MSENRGDIVTRVLGKNAHFGPFERAIGGVVRASQKSMGPNMHVPLFRGDLMDRAVNGELGGGLAMEQTTAMLQEANAELAKAKGNLQDLVNDVKAAADILVPMLADRIQHVRAARMSTVNESREMLTALRDIRRFFLESEYAAEMDRLERFVAVCHQLQELKASGTLDAVCDIAIRLAVKEPS